MAEEAKRITPCSPLIVSLLSVQVMENAVNAYWRPVDFNKRAAGTMSELCNRLFFAEKVPQSGADPTRDGVVLKKTVLPVDLVRAYA